MSAAYGSRPRCYEKGVGRSTRPGAPIRSPGLVALVFPLVRSKNPGLREVVPPRI